MPRITLRRTITAALSAALLTSALAMSTTSSALADTGSQLAASKPTGPAVAVCGAGAALVRPRSMILTCADNGELAERLDWSSWTRTRATATGTVTWRACSADCARSTHWESTSAQITLTDPTSEPGGRVLFTKLRLHVTGSTPQGFMRNLTFSEGPAPAPAASHAQKPGPRLVQPFSAPSGILAYAHIEGFWIDAGGPASVSETAAAITGAESSYYPGIIQPAVDYCGSGADRAGWGLWQITCGNSVPGYGTDFQILDPWNNAEAAVSKYNGADGFTPWSTYTSGAYKNYLQSISPDTALTDPGQYKQVNSTPSGTPASPAADPGSTYGPAMGDLCSQYVNGCVKSAGSGNTVGVTNVGDITNFTRINPITWQGHTNDVYQYQQDGTDLCLEFDAGEINGDSDIVRMATCSTSVVSQYWWYSGDHNLVNDYATALYGQQACMDVFGQSPYYALVDDCSSPYASGSNVWS